MAYTYSKCADLLVKLDAASSNASLDAIVTTLVKGVATKTNYATETKVKEILFLGGKDKPRSPLRDPSVTDIVTPRVTFDDEIYTQSIIELVNRYFDTINPKVSRNKIITLLCRLFASNVMGFYGGLNLPDGYLKQVDEVFNKLINAEADLINRFTFVIETREYEQNPFPDRFEYQTKRPTSESIFNEYLSSDALNTGTLSLDAYMGNMREFTDIEEDTSVSVENIPNVIRAIGYRNVLRARTDLLMKQKFFKVNEENPEIYNRLERVLSGFRACYLCLTGDVDLAIYQRLFGIASSTYKQNKAAVIRDICNIASSDEFSKFKELLLNN